jgi:enhancing lycopene biosynthesis protein 2
MKIAVLLHGSGVYDGTEIQEAVLSLLAIEEMGHTYQCIAPDIQQFHVVNHLTGEPMSETRNVLVESARIARGNVIKLSETDVHSFDALVMPGGFGTAKNFTTWALDGPAGSIVEEVKDLLQSFVELKKPIVALCMSPTTLAKAFENSSYQLELSVGSTNEASPYDIKGISDGITFTGSSAQMKTVKEISIDPKNRIICAPCYMMEASLLEVRENIKQAISALDSLL